MGLLIDTCMWLSAVSGRTKGKSEWYRKEEEGLER
jgi:hypothetical protein